MPKYMAMYAVDSAVTSTFTSSLIIDAPRSFFSPLTAKHTTSPPQMTDKKDNHKKEKKKNAKRFRWDEENLEENERLKAEMNIPKIPDPKTPWMSPSHSDHDTDPEHFELGGAGAGAGAGAKHSAHVTAALMDSVQVGAATAGPGPSSEQQNGPAAKPREKRLTWSSSDEDGRLRRHSNGSHRGSSPDSAYTSEDEVKQAEKRAKFEENRKKHYNMKEALARARALIEEEDEELLGDDEKEGGAGAATGRAQRKATKKEKNASERNGNGAHKSDEEEGEEEGGKGGRQAKKRKTADGK